MEPPHCADIVLPEILERIAAFLPNNDVVLCLRPVSKLTRSLFSARRTRKQAAGGRLVGVEGAVGTGYRRAGPGEGLKWYGACRDTLSSNDVA